jgi:hypothetical protein
VVNKCALSVYISRREGKRKNTTRLKQSIRDPQVQERGKVTEGDKWDGNKHRKVKQMTREREVRGRRGPYN